MSEIKGDPKLLAATWLWPGASNKKEVEHAKKSCRFRVDCGLDGIAPSISGGGLRALPA
jgi:hypothetical protein